MKDVLGFILLIAMFIAMVVWGLWYHKGYLLLGSILGFIIGVSTSNLINKQQYE